MTTEFLLIRHGETDWNIDQRYQGTSNTPLNATGVQQAAALAEQMAGEQWDVMASSPLLRAWNTALPVAAAIGIAADQIIPDENLIERHYGIAEGLTLPEREARFPGELWDGLESRDDLCVRSMRAMEDYLARFADKRIIIVTHGTWIKSVLEIVTKGEFGYGTSVILNTSRTSITHDGSGWHAGQISLAPHLAAVS